MKSHSLVGIAILTLLMGSAMLVGCGKADTPVPGAKSDQAGGKDTQEKGGASGKGERGKEEVHLKLSPEERETAGLKVEELKMQPVADQVALTATIRANQDRIAHVAPRVPGRVVRVMANLGDKVRGGQAMAQLDSLELGDAHSAYQQARSQLSLATADFERAEKLKAEDIIPNKDFLRARSEFAHG